MSRISEEQLQKEFDKENIANFEAPPNKQGKRWVPEEQG